MTGQSFQITVNLMHRVTVTYVVDVTAVSGTAATGLNEWGDEVTFDATTGAVQVTGGPSVLTGTLVAVEGRSAGQAAHDREWLRMRSTHSALATLGQRTIDAIRAYAR